jgi:hypothetical protein
MAVMGLTANWNFGNNAQQTGTLGTTRSKLELWEQIHVTVNV